MTTSRENAVHATEQRFYAEATVWALLDVADAIREQRHASPGILLIPGEAIPDARLVAPTHYHDQACPPNCRPATEE